MKYVVTSYVSPDLDGTSCMYAYSEFLRKTGKDSDYYIAGTPMQEVQIVCDMFHITLKGSKKIGDDDKVVIVDTNDLELIPAPKLENIVEFIDHHIKYNNSEKCKNAKFQIEMVGAAATLVAEKFQRNKVEISRESSILLYYGIISNTINFKAKVTTAKDLEMAKWLKEQWCEICDEKVAKIFIQKSHIRENLKDAMEAQVVREFQNKKITIAQLEYANMEEFLQENEEKIRKILKDIKHEKKLDYILINCVDILKGYSTILVIDEETEKLMDDLLQIKFENQKAKTEELILRKEIYGMLDAKTKKQS